MNPDSRAAGAFIAVTAAAFALAFIIGAIWVVAYVSASEYGWSGPPHEDAPTRTYPRDSAWEGEDFRWENAR